MARTRDRRIRDIGRGEGNVAKAAADVLGSLTKLGLTLASLPAAYLPPELRDDVYEMTRGAAESSAHFPRAVADALDEFADDIERRAEREGRYEREDLGSRRRRERRRRRRRGREDVAAAAEETGAAVDEMADAVEDEMEDEDA